MPAHQEWSVPPTLGRVEGVCGRCRHSHSWPCSVSHPSPVAEIGALRPVLEPLVKKSNSSTVPFDKKYTERVEETVKTNFLSGMERGDAGTRAGRGASSSRTLEEYSPELSSSDGRLLRSRWPSRYDSLLLGPPGVTQPIQTHLLG
ncbi:hypothetical protein SKAU_G00227630 [Synaphobranchus kaupii]|uniref:Uncharacterized protein n=1 Tax=Synaphobranchus kaupii TaxID=118154 RepID=A0A9Q1F4Y7_SYNKA|nr:hypothetical protein SKAU_G00227630 [Synaphobranchus kaupii]